MLGLKVYEGQYLLVGDVLMKVRSTAKGRVQVAIDAGKDITVLRFGEDGQMLNSKCRVRTVVRGSPEFLEVELSCGHIVTIPATSNVERDAFTCDRCQEFSKGIQQRIANLGAKSDCFDG